jgi:hypothetical protein
MIAGVPINRIRPKLKPSSYGRRRYASGQCRINLSKFPVRADRASGTPFSHYLKPSKTHRATLGLENICRTFRRMSINAYRTAYRLNEIAHIINIINDLMQTDQQPIKLRGCHFQEYNLAEIVL